MSGGSWPASTRSIKRVTSGATAASVSAVVWERGRGGIYLSKLSVFQEPPPPCPLVIHALHAALAASVPLVCFLTAVIWLAEIADRTGLAGRIAHVLARAARGSTARLYVLVCLACALLTRDALARPAPSWSWCR